MTMIQENPSTVPWLSGFKFKRITGADDRILRIVSGGIKGKTNTTLL